MVVLGGAVVPSKGRSHGTAVDATRGRQPTRRADFERWLAAVPYPESKPTLDQLVVDTEGRLWAQVIGLNAENGWLIFDVEGALVARASLPAALRVLHIGPDHILGVRQDELEVEYVELYGIIR